MHHTPTLYLLAHNSMVSLKEMSMVERFTCTSEGVSIT